MANLFELLGIEPTNVFNIVKKAYFRKALEIQPDKFEMPLQHERDERDAKTAEFQNLATAYAAVDNASKLNAYFRTYQTHQDWSDVTPQAPQFTEEDATVVFIPVTITEQFEDNDSDDAAVEIKRPRHLTTQASHEEFMRSFNFEKVARVLTHMSRERLIQVGVTFQDAEKIVNQHAHYDYKIIVKVSVPINHLSDSCVSERELTSALSSSDRDSLSSSDRDSFLLLSATNLNATDIISASPMEKYTNAWRIDNATKNLRNLWPQARHSGKYIQVVNPQRSLESLAQKAPAIVALTDAVLTSPSAENNTSSLINAHEPIPIEKAIQYLNTELKRIGLPALSYAFNSDSEGFTTGAHFIIKLDPQLAPTQLHLIETLFSSSDIVMNVRRLPLHLTIQDQRATPINKDKDYPVELGDLNKALLEVSELYAVHRAALKTLEPLTHALNSSIMHCFLNQDHNPMLGTDPIVFASDDISARKNLRVVLKEAKIQYSVFHHVDGKDGHPFGCRFFVEQRLSEKQKQQLIQGLIPKNAVISDAETVSFFGRPPLAVASSSADSALLCFLAK